MRHADPDITGKIEVARLQVPHFLTLERLLLIPSNPSTFLQPLWHLRRQELPLALTPCQLSPLPSGR